MARLADRRGIDQRHDLLDVIHDDAIKQVFVAILQSDQVQVLFEIRGLFAEIAEHAQFLLGHRVHAGR